MPVSRVSTTRSSRRPGWRRRSRPAAAALPPRPRRAGRLEGRRERVRSRVARTHSLGPGAGAGRRSGRTGIRVRAGRRGRRRTGHRRRRRRPGQRRPRPGAQGAPARPAGSSLECRPRYPLGSQRGRGRRRDDGAPHPLCCGDRLLQRWRLARCRRTGLGHGRRARGRFIADRRLVSGIAAANQSSAFTGASGSGSSDPVKAVGGVPSTVHNAAGALRNPHIQAPQVPPVQLPSLPKLPGVGSLPPVSVPKLPQMPAVHLPSVPKLPPLPYPASLVPALPKPTQVISSLPLVGNSHCNG
jgi:hypothetical protein